MIEIDLLPLELRKKKIVCLEKILKKRFFINILICLFLFQVVMYVLTMANANRERILRHRLQGISSKKSQVEQLKIELAQDQERISLIEQVINNRFLWSQKLNRISELIVSGIWLNTFTVEKEELPPGQTEGQKPDGFNYIISLIIKGSASSRTKDEPALIGRFMQNLKDDPYFSEDFSDIEVGAIKKRKIAQTEIMDFILSCRFKPDKAETLLK